MPKLYTFGDSWAAGYGLNDSEKSFGDFIADNYGFEHKDIGISSSSLGNVLHRVTEHLESINSDDIVAVIIPPDIRWYTEHNGDIDSLRNGMTEYKHFIMNKTDLWFKYHHSLFIYSIINLLLTRKCQFILAHNYGKLDFVPPFKNLIDLKYILDYNNSLMKLLGGKEWTENYDLVDDGPAIPTGDYFIPNDAHPNEAGHRIIADLFINAYKRED